MSEKSSLAYAYHMGYDDALAKRKPDASKTEVLASGDLAAENAKLRELCATVIDDWMSKVCPSFPFCEFGGEYQDCTDETCGNQIYRQMARELGAEVNE